MITACIAITIMNLTPNPIDKRDIEVFNRAQYVCSSKPYGGCVAKFMKKENRSYRISCGKKEQFDKKRFDKDTLDAILYELRHLSVEDTKKALKRIGIEY